ncbi:phosphate ABC transporter substrate-binding protein PstS [Streptomyces sp. NPDC059506]|uniref:Phosphate-binding protein n=1 Tax=Streptomyces thermolineatus TaxID=44033 RepID=A0ABP6A5L8_9ACTN|nr:MULTISPECIES: phosphate ABC transporter substrate-binding protein PstS [unclassified Streptomyces]MCZ2527923.1 phosphate ABC transporter substrate-binding protein PstS [Streptomyces sp. HB2AG]PLW65793.1 phosphate ABC transporter substrate-binding protein PstS [Streptomyces sp. DJ]QMV22255.1 phosphate ABC transporter substrate-binding protein PstS [Streptomyces sp. SCUT-3]
MKLQHKSGLRTLAVSAIALTSAFALTACGSDNNTPGGGGETTQAGAGDIKCDGKGQLLAAGSTAQKNAMDLWVQNYSQACKDVQINYQGTGSGAGIEQFMQGKIGFAGSDSALKPEEVEASKKVCKGGQAIDLPMVGGPIAIGYNLPGVENLVLDAETIAKIFDSKITKWNDAAIKKLNPDAKLPGTAIQAFHRSDESGTTDNFTKYLKGAAPDAWKYEPAKAWEAKGGQSADGSSGVASQVKQVEGAIGYFELSYADANQIPTVDLDNGSGKPVEATTANASAAIGEAEVVGTGKSLALKLAYDTKAEGAYPISLVTYEIVCDKGNNAETLGAVKSFLAYTASEAGQKAVTDKGYAPLPEEIAVKVRETVDSLS